MSQSWATWRAGRLGCLTGRWASPETAKLRSCPRQQPPSRSLSAGLSLRLSIGKRKSEVLWLAIIDPGDGLNVPPAGIRQIASHALVSHRVAWASACQTDAHLVQIDFGGRRRLLDGRHRGSCDTWPRPPACRRKNLQFFSKMFYKIGVLDAPLKIRSGHSEKGG